MKKAAFIGFLLFSSAAAGFGQTITVNKPAGGDTWIKGTAQTITWIKNGSMPTTVRISLRNPATSAEVMLIQDNVSNTGSYLWQVPAGIPDGPYKIRVRAKDVDVMDDSDVFNIAVSGPQAASINVTRPAAGESWDRSKSYSISWTKSGAMPNTVKISLMDKNAAAVIREIADGAANSGSYSWTVPADVPIGQYKVRVLVKTSAIKDDSDAFDIGALRIIKLPEERPEIRLRIPSLSISNIQMNPNAEGFVITFGYKNSGTGPLPKGSEMPEKPAFRVLIDSKEVNRGDLFIPESPAAPGWEVATFHGCFIKYPAGPEFDYSWTVGNAVTVIINENKVNGMASDSRSMNLKPTALNSGYDIMFAGATLDKVKETMTITIRIDGRTGSLKKFLLMNSTWDCQFHTYVDIVPGQRMYTITRKFECLRNRTEYKADLYVLPWLGSSCDVRDIEHRNNSNLITFTLP